MEIRPATPQDIPALARIWNPVIRSSRAIFASQEKSHTDILEMMQTRRAAGHEFLVAQTPESLTGFATYAQFRGGDGYARTMEHTIMIAPEHAGKGIGHALMQALEAHARTAGAHSMFAGVSATNTAGISFHERIGYAKTARIPQVGYKFDQYLDLVLLQKFL